MERFDVPLSEDLRAHVEERLGGDQFSDAGSYLAALIERDKHDFDQLADELRRGEESGLSGRSVEEIIDEAFRSYGAARDQR